MAATSSSSPPATGTPYHACDDPQCGHATDVETGASNWKPQEQP
jgi:hypothetical protein